MKILGVVAVLALTALILAQSGCAAIFASKSTAVAMQTTPSAAEVWIDGNNMGTTPVSLQLSNKKSYTITFKKQGHQDATYILDNKVGVGWIVLDVLFGLVPVVVDAATGSWYGLDSGVVNMNLVGTGAH